MVWPPASITKPACMTVVIFSGPAVVLNSSVLRAASAGNAATASIRAKRFIIVSILLSLLLSGGGIAHPFVKGFFFGRNAEDLRYLDLRFEAEGLFVAHPGFGVDFRVGERDGHFEIVLVDAAVPLLQAHLVAVRIAEVVEPGTVDETDSIDDEGVAVPLADGVAETGGIGVGRESAAIGPDGAVDVHPFEEFDDAVLGLNELLGGGAAVEEDAGNAEGIALAL